MESAVKAIAAPNIIVVKSLASRLENAKNIRELGDLLGDSKGKAIFLSIHQGMHNLNSQQNAWMLKKNILQEYEMNYMRLFKKKQVGFEESVFVLRQNGGSEKDMETVFMRHKCEFKSEFVVKSSPHGYIFTEFRGDKAATSEELAAIRGLVDRMDGLEVVFASGLYRSQCMKRGAEDFRIILRQQGREGVEVATNPILAKEYHELFSGRGARN